MKRQVVVLSVLLGALSTHAQDAKMFAARANQAYAAESARQKAGICTKADNNASLNGCLTNEMAKTKANYLQFERALGALLRIPQDGSKAVSAPKRLSFDDAETAWASYRDKICDTLYHTYDGGTEAGPAFGSCVVTLTGSHMQELHTLFGELLQ